MEAFIDVTKISFSAYKARNQENEHFKTKSIYLFNAWKVIWMVCMAIFAVLWAFICRKWNFWNTPFIQLFKADLFFFFFLMKMSFWVILGSFWLFFRVILCHFEFVKNKHDSWRFKQKFVCSMNFTKLVGLEKLKKELYLILIFGVKELSYYILLYPPISPSGEPG